MIGANKLPKTKKEPRCKRRFERKLKELSRDLDFVDNLLEKKNIKKNKKDRLERKYNIRRKRIKTVREKIKRFNSRINQYQQNSMFVNNQGQYIQQLNNEEKYHQCEIANFVETQAFWRGIWSGTKYHHSDVEWLKNVKKELEQDKGKDKIDITKGKMRE